MKLLRAFALFSLLAGSLAGCVLPVPSVSTEQYTQAPTEPANPAYTSAAQTIIAQLTAVAPTTTTQPPEAGAAKPAGSQIALPAIMSGSTSVSPDNAANVTPESLAENGETETPEPSPALEFTATTELPTSTSAAPSPTLASNDPRARLGEPDWRDTFNNANNWPLFEDEHVTFRLRNGGLQMLAKKPEKWDGWMLSWTTLFNFYLEVTAAPQNCSGADRYGLLARAPSAEEAYLFGFTCDGQYSLRKWNGERFSYLVDWTDSDLIQSGAGKTNRLGLMADGDQISLYANGEPLTEISDRSYADGAFGVFISSANTENFKVMVNEVAYWELP